jgi:small subunit ribosomal protein S16
MAVHIRLSRTGAKKAPLYRVVVADQRSPRGGRFIENLGTYDPSKDQAKDRSALVLNRERLAFWRSRGAQPSHTLDRLLRKAPSQAEAAAPPAGEARAVEAPAAKGKAQGRKGGKKQAAAEKASS